MTEELLAKQVALNNTASELQQLRDMSAHQRKRIAEMLANFLKDLGEIGVAIGGESNENLKVRIYSIFEWNKDRYLKLRSFHNCMHFVIYFTILSIMISNSRLLHRRATVNSKRNSQWRDCLLARWSLRWKTWYSDVRDWKAFKWTVTRK